MVRSNLRVFILACAYCVHGLTYAQHVQMGTDSLQVEIGNPFKVYFKTTGDKPDSLNLQSWYEVVPPENILNCATWRMEGNAWLAEATLIFFDSGTVVLPPLPIVVQGSDSIRLHVYPTALPDSAQLAPIKDIIEAPPGLPAKSRWWLWLLGLLIAGLVGAFWWYWLRKRKPAVASVKEYQVIPQDVWNQRFRALQQRIPLQPQKLFYEELSALLRNWLEHHYGIPALERTTTEIMDAVNTKSGLLMHRGQIETILQTSDLVKFASAEPDLAQQMGYWRKLEVVISE